MELQALFDYILGALVCTCTTGTETVFFNGDLGLDAVCGRVVSFLFDVLDSENPNI